MPPLEHCAGKTRQFKRPGVALPDRLGSVRHYPVDLALSARADDDATGGFCTVIHQHYIGSVDAAQTADFDLRLLHCKGRLDASQFLMANAQPSSESRDVMLSQ